MANRSLHCGWSYRSHDGSETGVSLTENTGERPLQTVRGRLERNKSPWVFGKTMSVWTQHCFFFFNPQLFLLVGGKLLYNIVVVFVIHWHELAMDLHVFPIPIPPPTSLPIPSLWVFPGHQPRALVSCIQPGLVICFTLDNIHVSMLFSQIIPPSPSPIESKHLFCTSVSLFLFCI